MTKVLIPDEAWVYFHVVIRTLKKDLVYPGNLCFSEFVTKLLRWQKSYNEEFPHLLYFFFRLRLQKGGMPYSEPHVAANRNDCHYNDLPQAGSPATAYGNFLKSCRNALNLMTIYAPASIPTERCYAGIDYNPYLSGETSQETEHSQNLMTMERWLRVVKSGVPETYRFHGYTTDTFVGRVTSGAEFSKVATANPGSLKSFTTSVWHSGNYDEYTANPRLRFDFGLSFSPSQFQIQHEFTLIPDTHDADGDDYDVTVSRTSTDSDFTSLFYPHRATNGNVILLLRAGTDLRRFGGVTLEEPSTYENTIPEGFHVFNLGALSETPTFTIGNETAFPGFQTVTETHPKHTAGAAFSYYFLVDYGREGGFQFLPI